MTNLRVDLQQRAQNAGLTPNKLCGQHFLVDARVLARIVAAAFPHLNPPPDYRGRKESIFPPPSLEGGGEEGDVLEIGPGLGVLTDELTKRAKHVYAVDIDPQIISYLRNRYHDKQNIFVHHADALYYIPKIKPFTPNPTPYTLVSNLPFEITTPFLWRYLFELPLAERPQKLILLIQREVADRILIRKPPFNPLALLVQWFGAAEKICNVSRHAFWPEPQVEGAVVVITPLHLLGSAGLKTPPRPSRGSRAKQFARFSPLDPLIRGKEGVTLFRVIRVGFSHPRRQLAVNLRAAGFAQIKIKNALVKANLLAAVRAEALTLKDWQNLVDSNLEM